MTDELIILMEPSKTLISQKQSIGRMKRGMTKNYVSCYNMPNKDLEHFEVPEPVYIYIRQLENAIKYNTSGVKRLYPFRFGEEK